MVTSLRTVIFVDGQNFKKNLQSFSYNANNTGRAYQLDEKHFIWRDFFKGVLDKFNNAIPNIEHRLIRVYWYNAATISPFRENEKLTRKLYNEYNSQLPELTEEIIKKEAKQWWENQRVYFNENREHVFDTIQQETDFLEFKYVGQYIVKPYNAYRLERDYNTGSFVYQGTREGEKGVDIGIAIDMIAKMNFYDVAILVSGDADFQPVVRYLKDHLKQVYQFSIAKGIPPQIKYLSSYLKSMVDVFQYFNEEELLGTYLRTNIIPPNVLRLINSRLLDLRRGK